MRFGAPRFSSRPAPRPAPPPEDSGLLLIDKPAGPSSHDVVGAIRKTFGFRKVGHGGTLDPGATGLLLILVGKGTSLSDRVMGCDKRYTGEFIVGTETDTQDLEGEIVAELPYDTVREDLLSEKARLLTGDIYQIPPMASALKKNGVPLYKLARAGKTVEREPRLVHVYSFRITAYAPPVASFDVICSKGTYVRTLCHDLGREIGAGAVMKSLRRVSCGKFSLDGAIPFEEALRLPKAALSARIIPMHAI